MCGKLYHLGHSFTGHLEASVDVLTRGAKYILTNFKDSEMIEYIRIQCRIRKGACESAVNSQANVNNYRPVTMHNMSAGNISLVKRKQQTRLLIPCVEVCRGKILCLPPVSSHCYSGFEVTDSSFTNQLTKTSRTFRSHLLTF